MTSIDRDGGDDAPERGDAPLEDGEEELDEPQPATWAGKQGWSGLPDEEPEADDEEQAVDEEQAAEDQELTREADTLAVADQEEAREAALAGLRARTAEHAAKREVTGPGPAADEETAEEADEDEEGAGEEAADADATVVAATTGADQPPPAAEVPAEQGTPPRQWLWARFLAASFLIIVSMATATSISLLVYLTDIAKGLGGLEGLSGQLDALDEEAQNFLILGSDVRPGEGSRGRSDTTMLLRVDPDKGLISQLSIPRDLRVNIPGHGIDKFNAAYTYGGPKLTLQVVKQLTGQQVDINHVVNVDFNGFADAVDAIDCVYIDVDRHYLHSNIGLATSEQYAEIDIEAGYQRLCGYKALQYVRYRHEDNDIVRSARQQTFLREARQKVPPDKLLDDREELIDIFKLYTTSDIEDVATLVQLFKLMLQARNAQINQIEFPFESLGDDAGYVTAAAAPIKEAVAEFLGKGVPTVPAAKPEGESGGPSGDKPKPPPEPAPAPKVDLIDSSGSGLQYSTVLADSAGKEIKFPVLYPTQLAPGSAISDSDTREFRIDGPGEQIYHGYKFVITYPGSTYTTSYYGVSGTDWLEAPLFVNPSDENEINGRTYKLYYDAGRLRMVAFQRADAMYWVSNTLDKLLSNEQMLAIAQNLAVPGG